MNAYVEVATATVVAKASDVVVLAAAPVFLEVVAPAVATSALRVPSIAGTSISAVSPDYNFIGGLATAA